MKTIKIIIYGLAGLLVFSMGFFLFSFGYTSLESMTAQSAQSRLEELRDKAKELEETNKEWAEIDQTYSIFKKDHLLNSEIYNRFKQDLQMLARKNRLGIPRLVYKFKSVFSDVVKIIISVEAAGAYENIKRFIYDVENFKMQDKIRMVLFRKVHLNKMKNSNVVEGKLSMEVYFVK
jgi:Tfp pilus assembly protein PilO